MNNIENLILLLLLFCVVMIVFSKKLVTSLIFLGTFSLLLSVSYFIMQAPDVAITEAALGSGLSVLVYMVAIKKTGGGI
ncbi:MAG: hydrogenase subunit MbhD domain-containing protein [Candidatus Muiribacteriota bacterium]